MTGERALFGTAVVVVGLVLYTVLLDRLRRFEEARRGEPPWWFGYARDGANVVGGGLFMAGFVAMGDAGPVALFLGVALALVLYVLDAVVGKWLHPRRSLALVLAGALAIGLSVCMAGASLGDRVGALLAEVAPK